MERKLRTRLTSIRGLRRAALIGAAFLMAAGLATAVTEVAGAAPQPNISQVQDKINTLTGEFNKANQQYDQVEEQLTAAKARLKQVNRQFASDEKSYAAARKLVVQIADSSFEDSSSTSIAGLLSSNDPSKVLAEASIILQITGTRNLETKAFLDDATQLSSVQQEQQRTEEGIAQLAAQRAKTKTHLGTLLAAQKTILGNLTATQVAEVTTKTVQGGGGITHATDPLPTATQAEKAVAFAFAQLGCPYVYAGIGPCGSGFDCSGLAMMAWAAAGIAIPRDTYEQWAALPHISLSDLEPGDLLYYNDVGHVAIYVGGGMIIDAPTEGEVVREIPMDTAWYADSLVGAVRP